MVGVANLRCNPSVFPVHVAIIELIPACHFHIHAYRLDVLPIPYLIARIKLYIHLLGVFGLKGGNGKLLT